MTARKRQGLRALQDVFRLAVLLLVSQSSAVQAQQIFRTGISEYEEGTAGLGGATFVGIDNYVGEKTDWDQVPLFLYEGKRAFARGNAFGYRFVRNDTFSFAALARGRINYIDPTEVPELNRITERQSTIEAGITATLRSRVGELRLTGVSDVLDRHAGTEVDVTYRLPFRGERWTVTPWASVIWQDDALTSYYFGVSADETTADRPAYAPGPARNIMVGLNTSYALSPRTHVFANLGVEYLDSAISESPIAESSTNPRAFLGAAWIFGGDAPSREIPDAAGNKPSLWSWRIHWAYQLHHNIFPMAMSGAFTASRIVPETVPTQIGLTLSRLLRTSERADLYARASYFRHREEPFQQDFNGFNFSMTGMAKSYVNYSDQLAFRWGLGFGLSYVEAIPGQEVQKLVNYNTSTRKVDYSKMLVYLEAQWDFPLNRLIKSEYLDGCFAGILVTHRSGAFGGSTITGGVRGGSDWGGVHLECKM